MLKHSTWSISPASLSLSSSSSSDSSWSELCEDCAPLCLTRCLTRFVYCTALRDLFQFQSVWTRKQFWPFHVKTFCQNITCVAVCWCRQRSFIGFFLRCWATESCLKFQVTRPHFALTAILLTDGTTDSRIKVLVRSSWNSNLGRDHRLAKLIKSRLLIHLYRRRLAIPATCRVSRPEA